MMKFLLLLTALLPHSLQAATLSSRIDSLVVLTVDNEPLPYVSIAINGGATRISNANGLVLIHYDGDTLSVLVRRVGFNSYQGKVGRASKSAPFRITLACSAKKRDTTASVERAERLPLARNGFYERMLQAQNGAFTGEFLTPEDINSRMVSKASQFLLVSRFVTVGRYNGGSGGRIIGQPRIALQGRDGCAMNLLVDGAAVRSALGDVNEGFDLWSDTRTGIDDLLGASEVLAIEVYPRIASAPSALALKFLHSDCGLVAIWTRL